jgi:cellulose synthase/poly-beta-1,6-N-acetylglucosamine synthase-like glycosyltransferase
MVALKFIFWASIGIVFYSYLGYALLMLLLVKLKSVFFRSPAYGKGRQINLPYVTLIVSAYNEEDFIEKKIKNSLELRYPDGLIKLIFITDGSDDRTCEIIEKYPVIKALHQPERKGKVAAMNRAMQYVETPIVVFSDANTLLNPDSIKEIVKHYEDPLVGGVAGEKKVISGIETMAAGAGESLYWKYESLLKKLDSDLYTVVGAAGELFSLRTLLYENTDEQIVIEDFVQSLRICMKGFVIRYEPNAYAMESSSSSMKEEEKRKIRICAGAFQAMILLKGLFNIFKYPLLSFEFISHRVLRWTLCPVCLGLILLSNITLTILKGGRYFALLLLVQGVFYLLSLVGWYFANRNIRVKALYIPYYFLFMNISVFIGFKRFLKKQQSVLWEKSARGQYA